MHLRALRCWQYTVNRKGLESADLWMPSQSLNKVFAAYCIAGTVYATKNISVNNTGNPAFVKITFY